MPIGSKEFGYTKPGPYIYELLADLNITHKTASKLTGILAEASTLLEEHNQEKSTGTVCRLDIISQILDIVFRDGRTAHAKYYRVSFELLMYQSYTSLDCFRLYCCSIAILIYLFLLYLCCDILLRSFISLYIKGSCAGG